jgi:hypothetical protein
MSNGHVQRFDRDDEDAYLAWLADNPDGFVVNADRPPRPAYLMLHRADCSTLQRLPSNARSWTATSSKTVGTRAALARWAKVEVWGGELQPCMTCQP